MASPACRLIAMTLSVPGALVPIGRLLMVVAQLPAFEAEGSVASVAGRL
ncbi:MAG: hypothetical protein MSC31_09170 [Solirubrobacteraceae bacterium MAG38_C4-C5]|nr:hypothetical protein [Candidatus Siliceabacter maunaloa]